EDYKDYLAQNDGSSNAYTAEDETNYHFEVRNEAFEGALDRFSRFFIDPLMTDALSARELNAVDSEHSKNLENEFWRTRQVWRSLLNPEHPHCGFSTGNSTTLAGVRNAELRAFYEAKYSANLMNLAVVSPYPADQVEKWIREKFTEVPNRNLKPLAVDLPLQGENLRGKLVEVKSLTDVHQLWMRFELPEDSFDWRQKPGNILGGIIGHEGSESLLQELKKAGLATSLSAGPQRIGRQGFFSLTLTLTPEGMAQLDTVVERTFGMLNHLRSLPEIPEYLLKERQSMSEIGFRFRERDAGMAEARMRASMMHSYPYENLMSSIYLLPEPDQDSVRKVLGHLTPENVMVLVYAKDRETDQVEPHYHAGYKVTPLGAERLARFSAAKPATGVDVPATNPFIPSNFELVEAKHADQPWKYEAEYGDVWLRHDSLFHQPKVAMEVALFNDKNAASANDYVLGQLYASAVQLAMNPHSYPLNEAGVSVGISSERLGITLTAGGFSEKMPALANFVVPFLKEVRIDEAQFHVLKVQFAMALANYPKSSPLDQAFETFREAIREFHFTPGQQAEALDALTFADLQDYFSRVHDSIRVRAFVYGNMTEESVRQT
ncbi:MAG: insulinase family protein, partial [Sulfitobacter sp.]|nr:insulinase family protein [Sulfitobacter sp.]